MRCVVSAALWIFLGGVAILLLAGDEATWIVVPVVILTIVAISTARRPI